MSADKLLFTPGPLSTSPTVKTAMLHDVGSRDVAFLEVVGEVRRRLLVLAQAGESEYEAILMQGSGTFGIESVIGSAVPRGGKLLVFVNGAYGRRIVQMADVLGIRSVRIDVPEHQPVTPETARHAFDANAGVTHAAVIHCETTTGILNPVAGIGALANERGIRFIVDAMSSFGGVPLDVPRAHIDFVVSSSNKCIQGTPGFSFTIARRDALLECEGRARSLSLDLFAQWKGLEADGQFRFTPPTHAILGFRQALDELEAEGGIDGRSERYGHNYRTLIDGMTALGFEAYLPAEYRSHIITSFRYPPAPAFRFERFYSLLSDRGFVIYPGKLTTADCFRIGTIGHVFPADVEQLLRAIREVLNQLGAGRTDAVIA